MNILIKTLRGNLHKTVFLLLQKSHWCLINEKSKPNSVKYSVWEWCGVFSLSPGCFVSSWQSQKELGRPRLPSAHLPEGPVWGCCPPPGAPALWSPKRTTGQTETWNSEKRIGDPCAQVSLYSYPCPFLQLKKKHLNWILSLLTCMVTWGHFPHLSTQVKSITLSKFIPEERQKSLGDWLAQNAV